MKRRIIVLGSNSFSGADFIDLLLEDPMNEVIGISRSPEKDEVFLPYHRHGTTKRFQFYQFDLNQPIDRERIFSLLDKFQPEYIVNFAAQSEVGPSWSTPWHWFETNAVALSHLIDRFKNASYLKSYVHISSPEIYGSCQGVVKEDSSFNPSTPYAASKAAADLLLFSYFKNYKFPLVIVRATNVYGVGQQLFKIVPRTVISIKSRRPLELHGGGKVIKSYIHIRDVSRGELAAMLHGQPGEVYHFSPQRGITVREVVETICARMGVDFSTSIKSVEERLGQDNAYVIDSSKAQKEFGWKVEVPLEEGIDQVIEWINRNWDRIEQLPFEYIHKE